MQLYQIYFMYIQICLSLSTNETSFLSLAVACQTALYLVLLAQLAFLIEGH
jgi:hypothetical protein